MDFVPLAVAGSIVVMSLAFLKHLSSGQFREALTLAVANLAGIGVAFLLRASDFAKGVDLADGLTLADVNVASCVLAGVAIASVGRALFVQPMKAIDQGQSAAEPKLFTGPAEG